MLPGRASYSFSLLSFNGCLIASRNLSYFCTTYLVLFCKINLTKQTINHSSPWLCSIDHQLSKIHKVVTNIEFKQCEIYKEKTKLDNN